MNLSHACRACVEALARRYEEAGCTPLEALAQAMLDAKPCPHAPDWSKLDSAKEAR
jgi:hypothetical protein